MSNVMPIIPIIIDQHAEETAFNWLLRDRAVSEPHYDLADLAQLDERVEANIDGLRIAGDDGWEICREAMALETPGEIFSAGVLAFESGIPKRMDAMLAAVENDRELQRALVSALGWIDFDRIREPARELMGAQLSFLKLIGLSAYAVHRRDPGAVLATLVNDPDPHVRARALKSVGELGRSDLLPLALDHLKDEDEKCRFHAAGSAVMVGADSAVAVLQRFAESQKSSYAARACELSVRKMEPGDAIHWLENVLRSPGKIRLALTGMGALGDPAVMGYLLEAMRVPEMARPAGEAFSMITGVDITYDDLEGEWPDGFEAGPTEDPEDEDVEMDPDEDLPWPDPEKIQRWWDRNKADYKSGIRYLRGQPIGRESLDDALKNGFQRQRIAAAVELALRDRGAMLFEWRSPGYRQVNQLSQ
jgi:uncharacterized protein (TIGR02270 family)